MQTNGPQPRLPMNAAPGKRKEWRAFGVLILGAGILLAAQRSEAAGKNWAEGAPQAPQAAPSDFVGAEACATCHEDVAKGFASNPHSKLAEEHGKAGVTCESCHGPGRAHVESGGDKSKIFRFSDASAKEVDEKCLGCHQGQHANFERSAHGEGNVSCVGCHSVHASADKEHLLKAAQPTLCYQCHSDIRPQFGMAFHHKVDEGLVSCSDCHDPHGTFNGKHVKSTADQNAICTKCHMETRGPFVYEHVAVKVEGCLGCHSPHGSQNARLLNMPGINMLCNQCHSPVAAHTVAGVSQGSSELSPCTSCHTYIHGSNVNAAFLR